METGLDSLFEELQSSTEFLYFEEERFRFDSPNPAQPELEPLILDREFVLRCKMRVIDQIYSIAEYKSHIAEIIKQSLREIEYQINLVKNRRKYISLILHKIEISLDLFQIRGKDVSKNDLCRYIYTGPPVEASSELSPEAVLGKEYSTLYQPFLIEQYESLQDLSQTIKKLFLGDIDPALRPNNPNLVFKYRHLFKNRFTSKETKEYLNDLITDLYNEKVIKRKSLNSFLYFYGLSKNPIKIKWGSYIGDLNTFVKYHNDSKLLTGHNRNSLPNYVEVKYTNWSHFHSTKDTDNSSIIIKCLEEFEGKLEALDSPKDSNTLRKV